MKKVIKLPNGTEEVIEGTPEEIAEYEKKIKSVEIKETPKKGPGLLTEEVVREALDRFHKESHRWPFYERVSCDPTCIKCSGGAWWGVNPPPCTCSIYCWGKVAVPYRFTWGTGVISLSGVSGSIDLGRIATNGCQVQ